MTDRSLKKLLLKLLFTFFLSFPGYSSVCQSQAQWPFSEAAKRPDAQVAAMASKAKQKLGFLKAFIVLLFQSIWLLSGLDQPLINCSHGAVQKTAIQAQNVKSGHPSSE